jgi:hypothetical protein
MVSGGSISIPTQPSAPPITWLHSPVSIGSTAALGKATDFNIVSNTEEHQVRENSPLAGTSAGEATAGQAVRHLEPTTLVPLVEWNRTVTWSAGWLWVPRRTMFTVGKLSMVQVPSMVTSAIRDLRLGNTVKAFPSFPNFP